MDLWAEARQRLDGLPGGDGLNIAHEAIDRHVLAGRGEYTAFRFVAPSGDVRTMTFAELSRATNRFANGLRTAGVQPGEAVFGLAGRVPELWIAAFGALKARARFSALYANFGEEPLRVRLAKGQAKLLVTTASLYRRRIAPIRSQLPSLRHVVVTDAEGPDATGTFDGLTAGEAEQFTLPPTDPEDVAFLHFTSGTAGSPKGALHVHGAVVAHEAAAREMLGLQPDDVFWCTADPGWVTGISYGLVAPALMGATAIVDEGEFDPVRWYRIIQEHKVSVLYTAPTAIRMLMKAGARLARSYDLSSLRLVASAGEALHPEAVRWGRQAFGLDIHDTWWQTETGTIMIGIPPTEPVGLGIMGRPAAGITAAIAHRRDDGGLDFVEEADKVGELVLRAGWPSMFRGYLDEPELYARSFSGDWYMTGDLVCRDVEGRFTFVSRGDELIKSAGHLIGPFEVESSLVEHPAVAEAGAIGKPDPLIGEAVKAFVALRDGYVADERLRRDLMAFARRRLGPALAPREITFCRSLPKTRNGKILRRILRARELGLSEADAGVADAPE